MGVSRRIIFREFGKGRGSTRLKESKREGIVTSRRGTDWQAGRMCPISSFPNVMILDGVELIFSTVVGVGLCYGFVLETALTTQGFSSYC